VRRRNFGQDRSFDGAFEGAGRLPVCTFGRRETERRSWSPRRRHAAPDAPETPRRRPQRFGSIEIEPPAFFRRTCRRFGCARPRTPLPKVTSISMDFDAVRRLRTLSRKARRRSGRPDPDLPKLAANSVGFGCPGLERPFLARKRASGTETRGEAAARRDPSNASIGVGFEVLAAEKWDIEVGPLGGFPRPERRPERPGIAGNASRALRSSLGRSFKEPVVVYAVHRAVVGWAANGMRSRFDAHDKRDEATCILRICRIPQTHSLYH